MELVIIDNLVSLKTSKSVNISEELGKRIRRESSFFGLEITENRGFP